MKARQTASRAKGVVAAFLAFACLGPARGESHLYTLEPLGDLGGGESRSAAINNHDWVVGEAASASGTVEAFLWIPSAGMRPLGTLGGANSRAHDVNDAGTVVGEAQDSNGVMRAFRWTEAGGIEPLPATGQVVHSSALAINEHGQITGVLEDDRGMHAVLWENGRLSFLNRLPGSGHMQPFDVNLRGDVVGQIAIGAEEDSLVSLAFYFQRATEARNLAEFRLASSQSGSATLAINNAGLAVGYVMLDSSRVRAFRYHAGAGLEILEDHGALYTTAAAVNEAGWVAGSAIASYSSDEAACFWIGNRWYDVNEVTATTGDWWLVQASGINNRNVMTGHGIFQDRNQAFLLRPVPGRNPIEWPSLELVLRENTGEAGDERVIVLEATGSFTGSARRVVFYHQDEVLGAVEEPPFEWGWEGSRGREAEFFAEAYDETGTRIRSRRIKLAPLPSPTNLLVPPAKDPL